MRKGCGVCFWSEGSGFVMRKWAIRLVLATIVGMVVFCLSFLSVWECASQTLMNNRMLEDWTRQSLIRVYTALTEHRKPFPESLSAISGSLEKTFSPGDKFPSIRDGLPIDGWGRPLVYSVQGTTFTLLSYGRDGKPGTFDAIWFWSSVNNLLHERNRPSPDLYHFVRTASSG
jgi:hypothetical protein